MRNFEIIYQETLDVLNEKFPNKIGQEDKIITSLLLRFLTQTKVDIASMSFLEFSTKYALNYKYFDNEDFTSTQIKTIIQEAKLNERDNQIATMKYINKMCEDAIADKLFLDKKTVHSNILKISDKLKRVAYQHYKEIYCK